MFRSLLASSFLALWSLACDPTVAGKNDVLRFRYDADDTFLPNAFATPVGAGLAARVEVFFDPEGSAPEVAASVLDASSSSSAVVRVAATAGNVLTLVAEGPGQAEVRVQTMRGDDAFDIRVVDIAEVDLSHPGVLVSDDPPSRGIVGGTARFIVALKDAEGQAAIGFGTLPVTVAPSGAVQVLDSDEVGFVPVRFGVPGAAVVTGLGDEPLDVVVVADADVTALELKGPDVVSELVVDGELAAILRGHTASGDKVVGVASLATVASSAPEVCTITPNPSLGEGAYLIHGQSAGTCRVSATLGARAIQYDVTVKAAP